MSITLYNQTIQETKDLLFVGFDGNFESSIFNFPYENAGYEYTILNNPTKALNWLNKKVEEASEGNSLPYAIFLNARFTNEDTEFLLVELASHEQLRYTPLIMLSDSGSQLTKQQVRLYRVDDVYTVPVSWDTIEQRVSFLDKYKPQILSYEKNQAEQFARFKMPLGKRLFDIALSLTAIILLAPVWIPVVILIAIEDGFPVIYTQPRAGAGYHVFKFIKFRSMYKNADKDLKNLSHINQYNGTEDKKNVFVKLQNDPRVTRIGRVIRKYSIDELPQLINILKGDMSIVGNRPLPLYEAVQLTSDEWSARFLGPAGLTGLWQVTRRGKSNMDAAERIGLDIEYAYNYSMLNDMKIILKTFTAFIQKEDV
jgi:lipopolysaccharide/colanic/teichoic acid biosynthesis glycosyltransferase